MICLYPKLYDWCKLAKNEDNDNCIYGNFRYDVDKYYIDLEQINKFEGILNDMQKAGKIWNYACEYIEDACRINARLRYGPIKLKVPDEGVGRIMTHRAYYREYKSFIGGITISDDDAEELFDIGADNEQMALDYVNAKINQDYAEDYARQYIRTMIELGSRGVNDIPRSYLSAEEVDMEGMVWVFNKKYTGNGIEKYNQFGCTANYFVNKLSLFYPGIFKGSKYRLIYLWFKPSPGSEILHKPTIFSGGYPLGYCSVPSKNTWGCTMVFSGNGIGVPEAIVKRKNLGYAVEIKYVGEIDKNIDPVITPPVNAMVVSKLGYVSSAINVDNCDLCSKL